MHSNPTDPGIATDRKVRTQHFEHWIKNPSHSPVQQLSVTSWIALTPFRPYWVPKKISPLPCQLCNLVGCLSLPTGAGLLSRAAHAAPLRWKGSKAAIASSNGAHASKLHFHPQRSCHWCSMQCFVHTNRHWPGPTDQGLRQHCHCNKVSAVIWQKSQCTSSFQLTFDF